MLADKVPSVQRSLLVAVAAVTPVLIWRGAANPFQIPQATLVAVVGVLLAVAAGFRALIPGLLVRPTRPFTLLLLAFLVVAAVTTALSPTPAVAVYGDHPHAAGLLLYAAVGVIAVTVTHVAYERWLGHLVRALAVAAGLAGLYGVVQAVDADPFEWAIAFTGVATTLGQPNYAAGFLAAAVPAALGLALLDSQPTPWRVAGAAAGLVGTATVLLSRSAQGPVALAAALTVFGILAIAGEDAPIRLARRARVVVYAAVSVLTLGSLAAISTPALAGIRQGFEGRVEIWRAAVSLAADRPLTGTGLDTFGAHFYGYRSPTHGAVLAFTNAEAPHSVPLSMLTSGGIVLGLVYLAIVAYVLVCLVTGVRSTAGHRRLLLATFGAVWAGYQVQSLVSIDVPPLLVVHAVSSAAVVVLAKDLDTVPPGPPQNVTTPTPSADMARPAGGGRGPRRRLVGPAATACGHCGRQRLPRGGTGRPSRRTRGVRRRTSPGPVPRLLRLPAGGPRDQCR